MDLLNIELECIKCGGERAVKIGNFEGRHSLGVAWTEQNGVLNQTDRQGEILVQITELRLICLVKNDENNFAVILGVILINILLRVS